MLRVAEHARVHRHRAAAPAQRGRLLRARAAVRRRRRHGRRAGRRGRLARRRRGRRGRPARGGARPRSASPRASGDANERIHELLAQDDSRAGMGTTLTAAYVGESDVAIAHVGDSRAYRFRDGELERLTDDHSLVEELRAPGQLTAEEADEHPQRSIITRALGPEPDVDVDTRTCAARDGDVFLLCSDGLTSMIAEAAGRARSCARRPALRAGRPRARRRRQRAPAGATTSPSSCSALEEVGAAPRRRAPHDQPTERARPRARRTAARADRGRGAAAAAAAGARPAPRPQAHAAPRAAATPRARAAGAGTRAPSCSLVVAIVLVRRRSAATSRRRPSTSSAPTPTGSSRMYRGVPYDLPAGIDLYQQRLRLRRPGDERAGRRGARRCSTTSCARSDDAADLVRAARAGARIGRDERAQPRAARR